MNQKYILGFDQKVNQVINSPSFEPFLNDFLSYIGHQCFLEQDNVDGYPSTEFLEIGGYTFKYTNEIKGFDIYVYFGEDSLREKGISFASKFDKKGAAELLFHANLELVDDLDISVYARKEMLEIQDFDDFIFEIRQSHGYIEDFDSEDFVAQYWQDFAFYPERLHFSYDLESKKITVETESHYNGYYQTTS